MSCCPLGEEPQQISKLPNRARCWAPLLHPLQEPELQTGLCNPRAAQAELQAELSAPRGAAELPSAHELLMRARIKLWHTWKTQALMHINLSHHLETPDLRGLSEPPGLCGYNSLLCKHAATFKPHFHTPRGFQSQSIRKAGRNKASRKEASIKSRKDFCKHGLKA